MATGATPADLITARIWSAGGESEEADGEGRHPRWRFLSPIAEMELIDDWDIMSLADTGSQSLRA